jgi:hypothetical protein
MLGLRVGTYTFLVDAPGFVPTQDEGHLSAQRPERR